MTIEHRQHVTVKDNGAAFLVTVDGLAVYAGNTLASAWNHIEWMYAVCSQDFDVGPNRTPVKQWLAAMYRAGWMYGNTWAAACYRELAAETDAKMKA